MKRYTVALFGCVACLFLIACGQRGPLYLPSAPEKAYTTNDPIHQDK